MDQAKTGQFIAALRKEKGLTQAELAVKLNVTDKSVSKWECGRCMPDASLTRPLCELLGISVGELFAGERLKDGGETRVAEESLLEIVRLYEKVKSYKHVLFGVFLIFIGMMLPTKSASQDASDFIQFLDGMFLGLSAGVKILGILWTLYGFSKASEKK